MKTTKNIWNSFLNNWMRSTLINAQGTMVKIKKPLTDFTNIRASDINVHFGEG